jgi:hypothetical protein
MPWTEKDVDAHKKGLKDEQKRKWVAVANSVLKKCMSKGGSESECAASAIRQANGVTSNADHYFVYKSRQEPNYKVVAKTHQGKNHLIVPVIMMVEGVHHGSHGPLLHQIDDLGHFPEAWNGIPVVINHPEIDGQSVSANHPDIIEQQTIGRVYNTWVDGGRLRAEAWIDEEKLQQLSAELLNQFKNGELVEVSLGMFSDEENVGGDWNGKKYRAIARNHRPDHLALLPGGTGACSIADGCGIRLNKEGGEETEITDSTTTTVTMTGTELFTYTEVDTTSGDGTIINESINITKKEESQMAETIVCTPCVKKKVDELIAHASGRFTEEDRERLETFDEAFLGKLVPETVEIVREVEVNALSDEDKAILAEVKQQKADKRNVMIKTIQDNSKEGAWTLEVLEGMKDDVLANIVGLIKPKEEKKVVDYSLGGAPPIKINECKEEPLLPTGIKFKTNN